MTDADFFFYISEILETLGLNYIHQYMEELGGFPSLEQKPGGKWDETKFNFEDLMIRIKNRTNFIPVIDVDVTQDDKNPSKYILYVSRV